jgi:hypothetical protein
MPEASSIRCSVAFSSGLTPSGEASEQQVAPAKLAGRAQQQPRGRVAARVGDRMGGLDHPHPAQHGSGGVADDDHAAVEPRAEDALQGSRDREARLARAEDHHPALGIERVLGVGDGQALALQAHHALDRAAGIAGGEAGAGDAEGDGPVGDRAVSEQRPEVADRRQPRVRDSLPDRLALPRAGRRLHAQASAFVPNTSPG